MRRLLLPVLYLFSAAPVAMGQAPAETFAFVDVTVIPMDRERVIPNQTVVVLDGVIQSVSLTAATTLPADLEMIDASGAFLMPGLADLHVHLLDEDQLVNYLAWGVTTVMHLGGSGMPGGEVLALRDAIAGGDRTGPSIYTTNRVFDGAPRLNQRSLEITDVATAREEVLKLREQGFDFVKIYNNLGKAEFDATVAEAGRQGMAVVGHIPRNFDALASIGGGLDAIAHTEELFFAYFGGQRSTETGMPRAYRPDPALFEPLLDLMQARNVTTMPDLSFTFTNLLMWDDLDLVWNDPELAYLHPEIVADWRRGSINRRENIENFIVREQWKYELMLELTRRFDAAGISQVIGTDSALPGLFPGKAVHRELTELVKAGLSNFAALAAGTRNAGEFVHERIDADARFGQLNPGFRADLVLLEANPLDDIRNARRILGVTANGRYFASADLERLRDAMRERYADAAAD